MGKLDGKVALVTGASRGIGQGIAEALAAEGSNLVLLARDAAALERNAGELGRTGVQALPVTTDVADEQQVQNAFALGMERFSRLDLLINTAGISEGGALDELTLEAWDRVIAANLRGPFLCAREAFRIMKRARAGRIINIASIGARRVRPHTAPYSTSKRGLWG